MRRKSNSSRKSIRTRKNMYKRVKISKQKTRRNKLSHRGGGLGNYLWKGFNVFKKDPLQIRSKGREADASREILQAPRFWTMKCAYSNTVFGRWPKLADLCAHFQVQLTNAHDARGDSRALAECIIEAERRGVMLNTVPAPPKNLAPSTQNVLSLLQTPS